MITPLTITSLSQGTLRATPQSEDAYWASFSEQPKPESPADRPAPMIAWPLWVWHRRAERG
ncbi:MAG: hypothetical protein V4753_14495 [Pseudomonadota bacterium]